MSSTTRSIPREVESIEELYSNKMYRYKPPAPTPLATITEEGETIPRRNWQKLRFFNFENLSKEEEREKTRLRKAKAMKNPGYRKRMKAGAKARARKMQFPDVLEHIEHIMCSSGCMDRSGNVTPIAASSSCNGFLTASSCGSSQTDTSGGGDDTWYSTASTGQSTSDADTPGGISVVVEEYEELLAGKDLMVQDEDEEDLFNQAIIVSPLTPTDEVAEQELGNRIWREEVNSRENVCCVDGTDFNVDVGKIVKDDVQIASDCVSGSQDNHVDVGYFANVNEEEFMEHVLDTSHIPSFLNTSGDGKDVKGELQLLPMFCDEDDNGRPSGKKGVDKPQPRRSMRIAEMRRCSLVVDGDVSPAVPSASSCHQHRRKRRNRNPTLIGNMDISEQGDKNNDIQDGSSGNEGAGSGIPPVYNLRRRVSIGLPKKSCSTHATSYLPLPRKTLSTNSLLLRRPRQTSSDTKHKLYKAKKQSKSKKGSKLSASIRSSPLTASSTTVPTVTTEPEHHPLPSMSSPMQCVTVAGAGACVKVKMSGDAVVDEENGGGETVVEDVLHGLSSLRVSDVNSTDGPNHIDPEPYPSIPLMSPISHSNSMTTPHTPTPCLTTPHTHSPSSHKSPVFRQVLQDVSNTIPSPIYCGAKGTVIQVPLPERDC